MSRSPPERDLDRGGSNVERFLMRGGEMALARSTRDYPSLQYCNNQLLGGKGGRYTEGGPIQG